MNPESLNYNKSLFSFLSESPTPFHAVFTMATELRKAGFMELDERKDWKLIKGNSYFIVRENGALIAFTLGKDETLDDGFRIIGAHTDSPCLQIKPRPDIRKEGFHQLGVEVYGGAILSPWFDRELSLAGRVCCRCSDQSLQVFLLDFKKPLLVIPSVAIHLNRDATKNSDINKQTHLPPILALCDPDEPWDIKEIIGEQLKAEYPESSIEDILSFDLFCYDFHSPVTTGINGDFISAPRLDNLLSCHAGLRALIESDKSRNCLLFCANHEENGSLSSTGAQGAFLPSVFERILPACAARQITYSNSFLVSADNAHATHPNYLDKTDPEHKIHLNKAPVIKVNANQRYSSNSISSAVFKEICRKVDIVPQEFVMRSDMACGSTIGPMSSAKLGIKSVDIGAPTLGMHSIREITGSDDPILLFTTLLSFVDSDFHKNIS
jgi:aspartyl aminopeptidase